MMLAYEYLTDVLNHKLLDWLAWQISIPYRGDYDAYNRQYIEKLPIIIPTDKSQRHICDRLVSMVSQMSAVQATRQNKISDVDRRLHDQRVKILDQEINALVYELYGLTEEEIGIVEAER